MLCASFIMRGYAALTFLILIWHCSCGFHVKTAEAEDELVAVTVLFRDGDKTPSSSFPNDPYFKESFFPMGFEQLTEKGKMRQYELGQWYRQRYNTFLPQEFNIKDIHVRSSDTDRTLMSALVNLAGLYPPVESQLWHKDIQWLPVPVHTIPTDTDQVVYMQRTCPKFYRLYDDVRDSRFYQLINKENVVFYRQISVLTGWQVDDVDYFYTLQQVLKSYTSYNDSFVPSWGTAFVDQIDYLASLSAERYTHTDELKRLGDGPFYDNLVSNFDKVLDPAQESPKFFMLSGHESTIASVLNGVGLFDMKVPEPASSIIWELRKDSDGEHYVNWFYKRSDGLEELTLEGCGFNCKYDTFKSILAPITVDLATWDQECLEN